VDNPAQFVSIAKRILRELRTLNETVSAKLLGVQKQIESIAKEHQATKERENPAPEIRAILNPLQGIQAEQHAGNHSQGRYQNRNLIVSVAGVLVLLGYTIVNYKMLCAMRKANKAASDSFTQTLGQMQTQTVAQGNAAAAAQRAATTAEHTLGLMQLQQRALVVLEIPPKFDKPDNSVTYAAKNFGRSVASKVRISTAFVDEVGESPAAQDKACSEIATPRTTGFVNWELLVPEQAGNHRKSFLRSIPSGKEISYFVGCIRYADPFSENRWTRFCYQASPREPGILVGCFGYNSIDEDKENKPNNERQKASK
jgi:RNase H-fold protein (predicted Holliday junction resolvase)